MRSTSAWAASGSTVRPMALPCLMIQAGSPDALGDLSSFTSPLAFSTALTSFCGTDHAFFCDSLRTVPIRTTTVSGGGLTSAWTTATTSLSFHRSMPSTNTYRVPIDRVMDDNAMATSSPGSRAASINSSDAPSPAALVSDARTPSVELDLVVAVQQVDRLQLRHRSEDTSADAPPHAARPRAAGRSRCPSSAMAAGVPDPDAPPDSPPHWLPGEAWVSNHWLPYDETPALPAAADQAQRRLAAAARRPPQPRPARPPPRLERRSASPQRWSRRGGARFRPRVCACCAAARCGPSPRATWPSTCSSTRCTSSRCPRVRGGSSACPRSATSPCAAPSSARSRSGCSTGARRDRCRRR